MSANTKANGKLELLPLQDHELESVSGGNISVQQPLILHSAWGSELYGQFAWDFYHFRSPPQ